MEKKVVFDTNILIELSRGKPSVINQIHKVAYGKTLCVSAITASEFMIGARNKQELVLIKDHLTNYEILSLTKDVSEKFIEFSSKFGLSHKPFIPDLLIAATCVSYNIPLFTLNTKDFRYINGLELIK